MDFKEKVRHMVKMGIPQNRIVMEKYVIKNVLKNLIQKQRRLWVEKKDARLKKRWYEKRWW